MGGGGGTLSKSRGAKLGGNGEQGKQVLALMVSAGGGLSAAALRVANLLCDAKATDGGSPAEKGSSGTGGWKSGMASSVAFKGTNSISLSIARLAADCHLT